MKKRMLSALLALCMMLTMVPAAFAADDDAAAGGSATTADNAVTESSFKESGSGYSVVVTNEGEYYEAAFSTEEGTAIDETVSGSTGEGATGTHGFWVGLTLTAPDNANAFVWDYSGNEDLTALQTSIANKKQAKKNKICLVLITP